MVAKQKSESRQKTKVLGVRATPAEHAMLKARADAFGVSMGELCRQTLFGTQPKSKIDQEGISEVARARAELGRQGGMLKGWLSGAFPDALPPPLAEVKDLLNSLKIGQSVVVTAVTKLLSDKT